jgi:hypothetical protein
MSFTGERDFARPHHKKVGPPDSSHDCLGKALPTDSGGPSLVEPLIEAIRSGKASEQTGRQAPWIKEARDQGRLQAEFRALRRINDAERRARFYAERVTPTTLAQFMTPYEVPIQGIVQDLTDAGGLTVKPSGPGYVYDSETTKPGVGDESLNKFALAKKGPVAGGGGTVDNWGLFAFGQSWEISSKEEGLLGEIDLLPIADETTHFGGVRFKAVPYIGVHPELEGLDYSRDESAVSWNVFKPAQAVRKDLQGTLTSWITKVTETELTPESIKAELFEKLSSSGVLKQAKEVVGDIRIVGPNSHIAYTEGNDRWSFLVSLLNSFDNNDPRKLSVFIKCGHAVEQIIYSEDGTIKVSDAHSWEGNKDRFHGPLIARGRLNPKALNAVNQAVAGISEF